MAVSADLPFDWRLVANGYLDRMAYERGIVDVRLPFAELRTRSEISGRAKACGDRTDFSRCIREGLAQPGSRQRQARSIEP